MVGVPRVIISALRGGSGKTILSIGMIAAWKKLGKDIPTFKKGPDYIDAGWLALAADRPCHNLDTFMIAEETVLHSFLLNTQKGDIAVIEGNRGLFDGIDLEGSTSTAELAKLLDAPVVLCIDATKTTRSMAAVVTGCIRFDPDVSIKGVILNRVAGPRHESILRRSIEHYSGVPVIGAVPKLDDQNFPERHMGLVPTPEHEWAKESIAAVSQIATQYLDLDALIAIAGDTGPVPKTDISVESIQHPTSSIQHPGPRIGIIKDSAFQFYYPENIEALEKAGAETVFFSPLSSDEIPRVDALYIGGGFPETHAKQLADNRMFRNQLKSLAEDGLPIYAECGGLMYLGEELVLGDNSYPMAGVLPVVFGFSKKPAGHGYTIVSVERKNPFFKVGTELKGHEFHYSRVIRWGGDDNDFVFDMKRGTGLMNKRDGACYKNVLATYTHIHALGVPDWAGAVVRAAASYKNEKKNADAI
ncbi:cobyrinate a,c-diamide synthase [Thermodesulfobacteriota bacterium]